VVCYLCQATIAARPVSMFSAVNGDDLSSTQTNVCACVCAVLILVDSVDE